ncbi:hypothetical protein N9H15_02295 [bacterium]|nr:hypothetical protein [bacterium]MDG1435455.1 hypothetical protein [Saprospiraceae bacterium]
MKILALFFEIIILAFGVYIYLFSTGKLKVKDVKINEKAESFRKENSTWMRLLSLLLISLMSIEVFLNVKSFF